MTPEKLKEWRERMGWDYLQASAALGCGRNTIARWEAGRTRIPLYIALACAALAYGLPPIRG